VIGCAVKRSHGSNRSVTLIMASNCMEMGSVDSTVESSSPAPCKSQSLKPWSSFVVVLSLVSVAVERVCDLFTCVGVCMLCRDTHVLQKLTRTWQLTAPSSNGICCQLSSDQGNVEDDTCSRRLSIPQGQARALHQSQKMTMRRPPGASTPAPGDPRLEQRFLPAPGSVNYISEEIMSTTTNEINEK